MFQLQRALQLAGCIVRDGEESRNGRPTCVLAAACAPTIAPGQLGILATLCLPLRAYQVPSPHTHQHSPPGRPPFRSQFPPAAARARITHTNIDRNIRTLHCNTRFQLYVHRSLGIPYAPAGSSFIHIASRVPAWTKHEEIKQPTHDSREDEQRHHSS